MHLPFDVEEMSERLREAVSVPTAAIASDMLDSVHETLARQMTIPGEAVLAASWIDDWHESLLASHASALSAAIATGGSESA